MYCSNPVRAVRAYDGQIGHPNLSGRTLLHKAHTLDAAFISGKLVPDIVQESAIDFIDDLKLPGQRDLEPRQWPLLKCLREQRVVCISQSLARDVPRVIPSQTGFVEKDSHQLRNRDRRMRIVHLNGRLLSKQIPVRIAATEAAHGVCERARNKKIFLEKAQA